MCAKGLVVVSGCTNAASVGGTLPCRAPHKALEGTREQEEEVKC